MSSAAAQRPSSGPVNDVVDATLLGQQLVTLPTDVLVKILRLVHEDLLKQALAPPGDAANNRRHLRQRTLRTAKIVYNHRTCVADCQIRDMSHAGCRVRLTGAANLPRHFELKIVGLAETKLCEVKWRTQEELGVLFVA